MLNIFFCLLLNFQKAFAVFSKHLLFMLTLINDVFSADLVALWVALEDTTEQDNSFHGR